MSDPAQQRRWSIPGMEAWLEEPDLFVSRTKDPDPAVSDVEAIRKLGEVAQEVFRGNPQFYWLCDLGSSATMSAEARREAGNVPYFPYRGFVAYGRTPAVRATLRVLMRGFQLLGKVGAEQIAICRDEAEARDWIAADRAKRARK